MRIALSSDDKNGLDSIVNPHFGRCPFFVLVDVEEGHVQSVREEKNPHYPNHQPGQIPRFIASLGANVMMAGGMGRRAIMMFNELGIEGVTGAHGTVRQAIERYLGGELKGAAPCTESQMHTLGESDHHNIYEEDEIGRLREEVAMLKTQLDTASSKLRNIEKGT